MFIRQLTLTKGVGTTSSPLARYRALALTGADFAEPIGGERSTEDEAIDLGEGASSVGDIEEIIAGID